MAGNSFWDLRTLFHSSEQVEYTIHSGKQSYYQPCCARESGFPYKYWEGSWKETNILKARKNILGKFGIKKITRPKTKQKAFKFLKKKGILSAEK